MPNNQYYRGHQSRLHKLMFAYGDAAAPLPDALKCRFRNIHVILFKAFPNSGDKSGQTIIQK